MVSTWPGNGLNWSVNVQEICRKGQEIVGKTSNGQERVQNGQEMFMKCQKMDQDVRQTVRKFSRLWLFSVFGVFGIKITMHREVNFNNTAGAVKNIFV